MAKNIALKVARVEKNMTQKELAQAVGISRQTSVLAFQLGDGFSNSVLPMSSSLMGYLAVSKIPYSKWLKFMMPLFLIWTALGCLFMLGALMIGY